MKILLIFLITVTHIWAEKNIDISGVIFSNYNIYTSDYKSNGTKTKDFNSFDIGRIYLTASSYHSENYSSKVTLEANTLSNGNNVFLKLAYLSYVSKDRKNYIDFGLVPSLWIGWEENNWENVFVEFTQMHYLKFINPSDKGIRGGILGDNLKIEAMVSNGEGFKNVESSKTKNIDWKISYLLRRFFVSAFYSSQLGENEKDLIALGIHYKFNNFNIGGSVFKEIEYSTSSILRNGFSIYSNYFFNNKNSLFLRWDFYDKNISKKDDISNYFIMGFKNKPLENIETALVYKIFIPQKEMASIKREEYFSVNIYVKY